MKVLSVVQKITVFFLLAIMISACARGLPIPGGDRTKNEHIFDGKQDLMDRLSYLERGMSKVDVFAALNVYEKDLIQIDRKEIITALFGDNRISYENYSAGDAENLRKLMRALDGYRLEYASVEREHGFQNPYRWRTNQEGYEYAVTLIFHDDMLFEKPILTGGAVKESSSKTMIDYFVLGSLLDRL
jgi:hypothetical protein